MKKYHISVNQFAEYSASSDARKKSILNQQIKPNGFLVPWYGYAKGRIKKHLQNIKESEPIHEGLKVLKEQVAITKWQMTNKSTSIAALESVLQLKLASNLNINKYELVSFETKTTEVNGVIISISPEVLFKTIVNGEVKYGGIKIHIAKGKKFNYEQCKLNSTLLYNFISENTKTKSLVDPNLCYCIDVFAERIVSADEKHPIVMKEIKTFCEEIKKNWPKAA